MTYPCRALLVRDRPFSLLVGTVVMNSRQYLRDKQTGLVLRGISWSDTAGDSFSAAFYPPSLPDPIVEGAMTTDLAAKMLVFTHPANPHNRDHESVFSSIDGGVTGRPRCCSTPTTRVTVRS